jgi:ethanolamine utilization protein EutP (predicted NTPase)
MEVQNYDLLKGTWIYQEIQQQIVEEQKRGYIDEQQQIVLEIVQVRFPRIAVLTKTTMENMTDLAALRALLIKVGTARVEREARQYLAEIRKSMS